MREIRTSGSEGGENGSTVLSYLYQLSFGKPLGLFSTNQVRLILGVKLRKDGQERTIFLHGMRVHRMGKVLILCDFG